MGALTTNRNKRYAELQFPSSSLLGHDHLHVAKKPKSANGMIPTTSSVSRLNLYPKQVTPISREIQAPILVVKGFTANPPKLGTSFSHNLNSRQFSGNSDSGGSGGDRMGNTLFLDYFRKREEAIRSCQFLKVEKDGKVVEDVDNDNDGEGDSGVEEVEKEDFNKSVEIQTIRAKYKELDSKAEGNLRSQPSTSSGAVLDLVDGKALESLSLNRRLDVVDVDDGVPLYRKLLNESARKHDEPLRNLNFDIKLHEEKKALFGRLRHVKKEEDILVEPFRPLTDDDKKMVANALSVSSRRKVLVTHEDSNITITGEVLRCLRPGAWLNDEVINLYLELLKEREKKEPEKFLKCHFFNTFFYKKLISGRTGYDYKSVRRWTSQKKLGYSLQECDKIFVPVHKEIHWCLAVINKKEKKFQYLDSLGGIDKQVMRVLAKYIVDEVKDKNGKDIDVTSWKQEFVTDLPNQENGYDCGVFMIKYADFYSRDIGLCFKQEHMPYFRLRTAKEILGLNAT